MMNIKAHGSEENGIIDRISNLPDDILTYILSFLSTKNAVQTCILSKRWINTWTFVSDLELDINEFGLPKFVDYNTGLEFVTKFELLVKNVLDKREISCVKRFRLRLDYMVYWSHTQAIVDHIGDVMKLGPRECLVKIGLCEHLNLNNDLIFTCASLTYLQLLLCTKVTIPLVALEPNSVNLPCLKILVLIGVTINDNSFKKLMLGCPVLEELSLKHCHIDIIDICSNTLKKLVIRSCYYYFKRLHISTPNLLYLDIYVLDMGEIMLLNMQSLVDASIYIPSWYDENKYVTKGPKLIHSLSNVENLRLEFLCSKGKVQKKDFSNSPIFINLQRLELVSRGFDVFDLVPYFLHHSSKLQELTLKNKHALAMELLDEETIMEGSRDALVQREFLKTVRIVGYKADDGFVDRLINKLLTHVKIIGNIIIDLEDDSYPW